MPPFSARDLHQPPSTPLGGQPPHAVAGDETTDAALVERARAGDAQAYEALFRRYYRALCAYATRQIGNAHAAEELVEDVFLRLWQLWLRQEPWALRGTVKQYLYGAVHNAVLKAVRRHRLEHAWHTLARAGEHPTAMGETPPPLDDALAARDLAAATRQAIDALPARCRETYVLLRGYGLSYVEAAAVMGTSPKTVENQLVRALKALRTSLAAWLP